MTKKTSGKPSVAKSRTLLMTIGLGVGVVAYAFGVFLPGQHATAEMRKQLREKRLAIMNADRLLYPIHHAQEEVAEAERFLEEAQAACPGESEISAIMGEIHRRAVEAQVEVIRFEPRKPTSLESMRQHPMALTLEGSFHSLWAFLHALESMPAPIWISELSLQPHGRSNDTLQMQLTLAVFSD